MTLTNQNNFLYPGMVGKNLEFFDYNSEMKFIFNGEVKNTSQLPFTFIQLTEEEIKKHPEVEEALKEWHPNSKIERLHQFLKCRYGGLDFAPDIENNEFKDGDYFHCEKRAICKYNGIICKAPKYQGKALSVMDIKLIKLTSTALTNEAIAIDLEIPLGSFHKAKQALYKKLAVQTKQEVALIAKSLNLI